MQTSNETVVRDGAVHILVHRQDWDKDKALKAIEALKKATKGVKPDPKGGGAAAIRELRDGR